jgi:hypothetical protein
MSVVLLGSTSGSVTLQEPAVAGSTVIDLPATSGTMAVLPTATSVLPEASGGTGTTTGYYGFKNRIINGGMVIDQRNAGASVTRTGTNNVYTLDRWNTRAEASDGVYTVQQVVDGPSGFINSLKVTVTTADASIGAGQVYAVNQVIEGYNIADLNWGATAASAGKTAQTVTFSFWVKSTLTGSFGASIYNGISNRSYPFLYTISTANTWEQKSVTIAGDTSGTWATDNTGGLIVNFSIGAGSNELGTVNTWGAALYRGASGQTQIISTLNATWQVTGVQLEKGSTATSFDYRPYGTELALCMRYYETSNISGNLEWLAGAYANNTEIDFSYVYQVPKRAAPTVVIASANWAVYADSAFRTVTSSSVNTTGINNVGLYVITSGTTLSGKAGQVRNTAANAITISSEL